MLNLIAEYEPTACARLIDRPSFAGEAFDHVIAGVINGAESIEKSNRGRGQLFGYFIRFRIGVKLSSDYRRRRLAGAYSTEADGAGSGL